MENILSKHESLNSVSLSKHVKLGSENEKEGSRKNFNSQADLNVKISNQIWIFFNNKR